MRTVTLDRETVLRIYDNLVNRHDLSLECCDELEELDAALGDTDLFCDRCDNFERDCVCNEDEYADKEREHTNEFLRDELLEQIDYMLLKYPELRFGQIIVNAIEKENDAESVTDLFYKENNDLINDLKDLDTRLKQEKNLKTCDTKNVAREFLNRIMEEKHSIHDEVLIDKVTTYILELNRKSK